MPIKVTCPNGHSLKIKSKYAGTAGLCPRCQARVYVPVPTGPDISEDAVMDLLYAEDAETPADLPVHQDPKHRVANQQSDSTVKGASSVVGRPMRNCPKCGAEVSAGFHICPHCRTYFREEASKSSTSLVCPNCGTLGFPGDSHCATCGSALGST